MAGDEIFLNHPSTPRDPAEQVEFDDMPDSIPEVDPTLRDPRLDYSAEEIARMQDEQEAELQRGSASHGGPSSESSHAQKSSGSAGSVPSTTEELLRARAPALAPRTDPLHMDSPIGDVCSIRLQGGEVYVLPASEFYIIRDLKRKPFDFLYEGWTLDGALIVTDVRNIAEFTLSTPETRLNNLRLQQALAHERHSFGGLIQHEYTKILAEAQGVSVEEILSQRAAARSAQGPSLIVPPSPVRI